MSFFSTILKKMNQVIDIGTEIIFVSSITTAIILYYNKPPVSELENQIKKDDDTYSCLLLKDNIFFNEAEINNSKGKIIYFGYLNKWVRYK